MSEANGVRAMSIANEPNTAAIGWAEKRAETILAESTKAAYWKRYKHLYKAGALAGQVDNPRTRAYDRAASRFCMAQKILSAHLDDDIELVDALWADVKQIESEAQRNKKRYEDGEWTGKKQLRNGKKASIKKLPDDWRLKLCNLMTNHEHSASVRILACTGCRPIEMARGVRVYRNEDGINFHIKGAKFKADDERGQEWRILTIPLDHPIGSTIDNGEYQASSAESLTKAIARKAVKLGYESVSAYSYRHQMASDMKFSKYSKKEIANALGHISTATQEGYGNSGAGGLVKVTVVSSATPRNKVKHSRKKFRSKIR